MRPKGSGAESGEINVWDCAVISLEYLSSIRRSDETNNFLLLRLAAASLVIYGHAFALAAPCSSCTEFFERYVHYRYSGDIGVHIFFVISGYLVVASYDKRKSLRSFIEARLLRIIPAFWICLTLMVLLGGCLTTMPLDQFFWASDTWEYLKSNALLLKAQFYLPGVVLTSNEKYGTVVNGSIWTLFVEIRLYLIVAIAGTAGLLSRRLTCNLVLIGLALIGIFSPAHIPFLGEYSENWRVAAFFATGASLYINRADVPMHWGLLGLLFLASFLAFGTPDFEVFAGACIAYAVIMLGYSRKVSLPKWIEDYSYGIYIYGWPVQQMTRHYFPTMQPYRLAFVALILSWVAGALSWHGVEKHVLRLKPRPRSKVAAAAA